MLDITTAGSYIDISGVGKVTRFSDDTDPWSVEEIEVTGYGVTINGELLVWAKPSAYLVTINVLSGTTEAKKLAQLIDKSKVKNGQNGGAGTFDAAAARVNSLTIFLKAGQLNGTTFSFTNGRVVRGAAAPSANNDGRTTTMSYTFVMETLTIS